MEYKGKKLSKTGKIILYLAIAAVVIGLIAFFTSCEDADKGKPVTQDQVLFCPPPEVEAKLKAWGGTIPHFYETPNGSQVYSGAEIPASALAVLDRSVEFSIHVQKKQFPEWTKMLSPREYEFWFLEADGLTPESKLPYLTRGGVMTADTVSFCTNAGGRKQRTAVFLPDFRLVNWQREDDLFWFAFVGDEHAREIQNDVAYAKTFFGMDSHFHKHSGKPTVEELMPRTLITRNIPKINCAFGTR